jgi:quercetin dioxygenase-like cupin family protein
VHVVGTLAETPSAPGVFEGHSEGLTRRALFDRARGTVHHSVAHLELAENGRIDRHLHAFEQAVYVLSGSLAVDAQGVAEVLAVDDYLWLEVGVAHALSNASEVPVSWLEVSAPNPDADFEDTVFSAAARAAFEVPYRRGHFYVADLPEPSDRILAGAGTNVGGASVKLLIDSGFGASQFVLMALQYVPGGAIKEHDHAFEEGFYFVEGEIEAVIDGETHILGAGDYFWSSVEGMHALTNRSEAPVRWLETQAPQPPSRHQFRYRDDWDRLTVGD